MTNKREVRYLKSQVEVREDGANPVISGYAAVFAPQRSDDLGGFVEQVDPHALDGALTADVRGLFNHDPSKVLGRTKSGTMRLSIDNVGLRYEIDVPDTQAGKDAVVSMRRGDIDASSFGFVCLEDRWDRENGQLVRTVLKADVFDCSPVSFPAYTGATASLRSLFPDGAPELPQEETRDIQEDSAEQCQCECPECQEGDCSNCSNADCTDAICSEYRYMKAKLEIATRAII